MRINLSIVLDRDGYERVDLHFTSTLKEMDNYLLNFKDHEEVRSFYQNDIAEFLVDHKDYIRANEKKNKRINNGRICITFFDRKKVVRMVPIIYQKDVPLLDCNRSFKKIKESLIDDKILKELYLRKRYLLSEYEIDLLKNYFLFPVSRKNYKGLFINYFVSKIKGMDENKSYYYLRSLMNLCDLRERFIIKTNKGVIDHIDGEELFHPCKLIRDNLYEDCDDYYFWRLMEEENYEELFKYYGLDEITRNCNYENIINDSKRK